MNPHDLKAVLATEPHFVDEERRAAFWMLEKFNEGGMWLGRWSGSSPWERHATTDELLHALEGTLEVIVLPEEGEPQVVAVPAGSLFMVPKGLWHRVGSVDGEVLVCGVSPGPTDHSDATDPRG